MTNEQVLNEIKKILPNYKLGKPLNYKEFKKHEYELFDLLSNEIKNRWEETIKEKIIKLIDEVKANFPDAEEIVVYSTEEYIDKIKEYLPQDVSTRVVPATFLPEQKANLGYIVPIEKIKPLKFIFEEN